MRIVKPGLNGRKSVNSYLRKTTDPATPPRQLTANSLHLSNVNPVTPSYDRSRWAALFTTQLDK